MKEYILCAALHYNDDSFTDEFTTNITKGIVVVGHRHHNCFSTLELILKNFKKFDCDNVDKMTMGFLTNKNRFVDRKEAYKIAIEAEQIKPRKPNEELSGLFKDLKDENLQILVSEDLY